MKKNRNLMIVLLIVLTALLLVTGCSATTANIDNAVMTNLNTDFDDDGKPIDVVTNYSTNASEFVVWAELHNAPEDTTITFVWYYEGDEFSSTDTTNEDLVETPVYCTFTLSDVAPEGNYTVEIYIDDRDEPDQTVAFTVSD